MRITGLFIVVMLLAFAGHGAVADMSVDEGGPALASQYDFTAVSIAETYKTDEREEILTSRMLYMDYEVHLAEKSRSVDGNRFRIEGFISVTRIFDDTEATTEDLFSAICGGRIDFVASYDRARNPQIEITAKCNGAQIHADQLVVRTITSLLEPAADFEALVDRSANGISDNGRSLRVIESDRRERRHEGLATGGLTERRWGTSGTQNGNDWRLTSVSYYDFPSTKNSRYSVLFRISGKAVH